MAKIENTTVYPLVTPNASDFVIGTDTSDDNRTVSFSISDITASGGLQDLQSVLDTPTTNSGGTAAGDISLTGNITVNGDIYPTTITAAGTPGSAGQILSSTGTGIQWIAAAGAQDLQDVIAVDPNTTLGFVMDNCDIDTTGSINMSGAAQTLALSNGVDMTLAVNSDITTSGNIILSGGSSVLNFGTTAEINDSTGSTGAIGSILTVDAGGTGVEWSTGIPSASMPTLQEVLNSGNDANGVAINFTGAASATFGGSYPINSAAKNTWSGSNAFSAAGTGANTAGISLSGSLWDGASTGTASQVLTSTATGIAWADLSTVGVSSVSTTPPIVAAFPADPITIAPGVGGVIVRQNIYDGASLIGCVPAGGTASTFLRGDGTWVTPTGAVSSVSAGAPAASTGTPLTITPTTAAVVATSNAYAGTTNVGHVPTGGSASTFLRGDGTWVTPSGGSAPEWVTVEKAITSKVSTTANDYYYNGNPGDPGFPYNWADHQTTSPLGATNIPDINLAGNILASNPGKGTCTSSYPNHQMCELSWVLTGNAAAIDTWTFELWKWNADASGSSVLAATDTQAITSGTASYTGTMTIQTGSNQNILSPGEIYYLTMRPTSILSNSALCLTLTFAWTGVV